MKALYPLAFLIATGFAVGAGSAGAQTTALNPNLMTSWTGGAAVQDDLDKRAGKHRRSERANSQAAEGCAQLPEFRAKLGRRNPDVRRLARLCRKAGYRRR